MLGKLANKTLIQLSLVYYYESLFKYLLSYLASRSPHSKTVEPTPEHLEQMLPMINNGTKDIGHSHTLGKGLQEEDDHC